MTPNQLDALLPSRIRSLPRIVAVIKLETAEAFGLGVPALTRRDRHADVVWPRQVAYWLSRELANASARTIGNMFGRDRRTVSHGIRHVHDIMAAYPKVRTELAELLERIGKKTTQNERKEL